MKQFLGHGLGVLFGGGTSVLLMAQPTWAAATQIVGVQVSPSEQGVEVILNTRSGDRPQVFAANLQNRWVADLINTQLQLEGDGAFRRENPAPGIALVTVEQLDANSVRVIVTGESNPPTGQILREDQRGLVLSLSTAAPEATATPAPRPTAPTSQPSSQGQDVLVPDPEVTINGVPVPANAPTRPPTFPRAVAPPVGDIAISNLSPASQAIDLGTGERVPRLVLREAPAREVLSLLARAANMNLAFIGTVEDEAGQPVQTGQTGGEGPTVTLDIENESVQDVFNAVLRITGLEANRVGRTIYVGPVLPLDARSIVTRTLRMNQTTASAAAAFLSAQGAATQRVVEQVQIQSVGEGAAARVIETRQTNIEALTAQDVEGNAPLLLRGLSVVTDERLNTVTLVGNPNRVLVATNLLTQLDARRRQVAVNVKVVDVDLAAQDNFNTSFSFAIEDSFFSVSQGRATVRTGDSAPPGFNAVRGNQFNPPILTSPLEGSEVFVSPPSVFGLDEEDPTIPGITEIDEDGEITFALPSVFRQTDDFVFELQADIVSNTAKILTDPTMVVQEGQSAQVRLTDEVVSDVSVTVSDETDRVDVDIEKEEVGLILDLRVDRIDDNGFVTLAIEPTVSSVPAVAEIESGAGIDNEIGLISRRTFTTGQIRMRDGQTLIVSGIITEAERETITKVPILGDLPIIGALFRSTSRDNERAEVIVLVTPQILDDSAGAGFGYNYEPGSEVQQLLEQRQP